MDRNEKSKVWSGRGSYFKWKPIDATANEVSIFHVEMGKEDAPVLLLIHGFPTCSIDWFEVANLLKDRFRVCALDFPGYGFSDKPRGWGYSLARDAELIDFYVNEIVGADTLRIIAHDRGSSVALNYVLGTHRQLGAAEGQKVEHLVLTNGNIFLPLSNLTEFQRMILNPETAASVLEVLTPEMLAKGMGETTFSPPRTADHPDVVALTETFANNDGTAVLHETIQYLVERSENEVEWLRRLASTDVPTTLIWGLLDRVSPPRVAMKVWNDYLMLKPGRNRFYVVPGANHYLQVDQPASVVDAFLHSEDQASDSSPGLLGADIYGAQLLDESREEILPSSQILKLRKS